ncbi:MAG: hypothetical protein ABI388_04310 [Bacteroidia bacterium]
MEIIIVKNTPNIAIKKCQCANWLTHWENNSKQKVPEKCAAFGCVNKPEIAATVKQTNDVYNYIIPFCIECNTKDFELSVWDFYLVSENENEFCTKIEIEISINKDKKLLCKGKKLIKRILNYS